MEVPIDFVIRSGSATDPNLLRAYAERRLAFALRRFESRARYATVRFDDVNGPRRGIAAPSLFSFEMADASTPKRSRRGRMHRSRLQPGASTRRFDASTKRHNYWYWIREPGTENCGSRRADIGYDLFVGARGQVRLVFWPHVVRSIRGAHHRRV